MAATAVGNNVVRRVMALLGEVTSSGAKPVTEELQSIFAGSSDNGFLIAPSIVWAGPDECQKEDQKKAKKLGPVCRAPDLRKKPIPPYVYGYCKEPEPELPMSCPPRGNTKKRKGPCCLNETKESKGGGCKNK